jgi:hypothetical protein
MARLMTLPLTLMLASSGTQAWPTSLGVYLTIPRQENRSQLGEQKWSILLASGVTEAAWIGLMAPQRQSATPEIAITILEDRRSPAQVRRPTRLSLPNKGWGYGPSRRRIRRQNPALAALSLLGPAVQAARRTASRTASPRLARTALLKPRLFGEEIRKATRCAMPAGCSSSFTA